ncbi:unnamed protein product [Fusarium venenatum]|uniref:Uncharacterized protein n=1 Tax=Fusarium venenatum TaxID=56646 RepID=A0A2L2TFV9_9HYPO|nr:uncharacterized protein FVRRES_08926 [Fusarium venenatum]CEI68849.1 unnamed protein product [Fusarium venenatum]
MWMGPAFLCVLATKKKALLHKKAGKAQHNRFRRMLGSPLEIYNQSRSPADGTRPGAPGL